MNSVIIYQFPRDLEEIISWCHQNLNEWTIENIEHPPTIGHINGLLKTRYRFCFSDEEDALLFGLKWA